MTPEEEIIMQIIADIIDIDVSLISPETTMQELGADELHMVEITMALEQAIDVEFPDNRLLINPDKAPHFRIQDILSIAAEYY